MKQTLTPSGLRGGFSSITAPVARSFKPIRVLIALLVFVFLSSASTAQTFIDTFISGPTEACVGQTLNYGPGPDACNSVYWKVVYNDNQLALGATKILCATVEKGYYYAYTVYDTGLIELGASLSTGKCGGLDYLGSTGSLPIRFKKTGKYKIETEPWGPKNGYPTACQNASKTVYVGLQAVGNITGASSVRCDRTAQLTYSIPPVPGTSEYRWSISNATALGFHSPVPSNGGATVTYSLNTTGGATSNITLSVTLIPKCAGEASVTRSMAVNRTALAATITQGLPSVLCRGHRYDLRAIDGNNFQWVVNFYSGTGQVIQSNSYSGFAATAYVPTDTRVTYMNYTLNYTNVCSGQAAQAGSGASVSANGCTPGARLAAQAPEAVPAGAHPNPVSDVLTVHIPEADGNGGFRAQLRDGLQRASLTGSTPNGTLRMDVRGLPAGVYLLQTAQPSGAVTSRKVLVIH